MRGSLKQRAKGSWSIILDLGDEINPVTGKKKRKQKWQTFHGTKKQAEDKLADLLKEVKDGTCINPSKLTLADWLREWLASAKKQFRPNTYTRYYGIIENEFAAAAVGKMLLQKVRATHIEAYYNAATVAPATLGIHQAILYPALEKAKRDGLVALNVAADIDRPQAPNHKSEDARRHCWSASEAQAFLEAAQAHGPQPAAFYALALDSAARKGELCGLTWDNLDLDAARMDVVQTLLVPGPEPVYGPPKTGRPRSISLAATTVALLHQHRQHQREMMMANRPRYADHRLVFAKEWGDLQRKTDCLGHPLQINNLGQREYAQVIKAAGVRAIKFHGLRHTCATLLLQARVPVHVVSERLGHAKVSTTMEIYAHVLPNMQREAADTIGGLLFKTPLANR
jgi:integrase